jgi:DNA-binding transcriptional regulator YdaS (Cro superfamily)
MNFQDLLDHFGSQSNAAKAVGTSPQVVSMWKRNGIPPGRQFEIQILTGGVLRAAVVQRNQQQP